MLVRASANQCRQELGSDSAITAVQLARAWASQNKAQLLSKELVGVDNKDNNDFMTEPGCRISSSQIEKQ